jgi:glycosyltransferase involved in cell wall biosynthesis
LSQYLIDDFEIRHLDRTFSIVDPLSPIKLSLAIRNTKPHVFWSPGFMPPAFSAVPVLFTIHDLIHIHSSGGLRKKYYNSVILPLARKADKVVTVSVFSQAEICEWTGLPEHRVPVISNGVSSEFSPMGEKTSLGYPYLFYVGARKAHKNIEGMLRAYAVSGLRSECHLLLSGEPDPKLLALAARLGIADSVHFAGFISEDRLPSFYRGAQAVVMVSTYEGFGLPVLEGMATGVPVLCSNTTSLAEIGADAVLPVSPLDIEEIAAGMVAITQNSECRRSLVEKGLLRANSFRWEDSAKTLVSLLNTALASH